MKVTKKQFEKAQETFSQKSLPTEEKTSMLTAIYSEVGAPVASPLNGWSLLLSRRVAMACLIVLFVFSGGAYASAYSLPGDLLYPIKVDVLEPIALATRVTDEAKEQYRAKLVARRAQELEILHERGTLTEEKKEISKRATEKHLSGVVDVGVDTGEASKVIIHLVEEVVKEVIPEINGEQGTTTSGTSTPILTPEIIPTLPNPTPEEVIIETSVEPSLENQPTENGIVVPLVPEAPGL